MILYFKINARLKEIIDRLMTIGGYRDYRELLAFAVENLYTVELELAEKESGTSEEIPPPAVAACRLSSSPRGPVRKIKRGRPLTASSQTVHAHVSLTARTQQVPGLFQIPSGAVANGIAVPVPENNTPETRFTLDRWLFGQINRLLPLKANCRALARVVADFPGGIPVEETFYRIGTEALSLGDYLADHDARHQLDRDSQLATAFPRGGPEADKSLLRYVNLFLGSITAQGKFSGMLQAYRMAVLLPGQPFRIQLTEPALRFAALANPVLDASQIDPRQKFSREEIIFLLEHIRRYVPEEAFAFRTLIQAIAEGATTPDRIEIALRHLVPDEVARIRTSSFLVSQRSGALSRMADLGLVERQRAGVRVIYRITPQAESFMHY